MEDSHRAMCACELDTMRALRVGERAEETGRYSWSSIFTLYIALPQHATRPKARDTRSP